MRLVYSNFKVQRQNNVVAFIDEEGNDWYDVQGDFKELTVKVMYRPDGYIAAYTQDASTLAPDGCSVAEFNQDELPEGFGLSVHLWAVKDDKIVPYELPIEITREINEGRRAELARDASFYISMLNDKFEFGEEEEGDEELLKAWKHYRIKLSKVDIDNPEWPEKP